ncbi:protein WEAK CHLOROPLAST MOVEMENT UNDER BLUE LIGHT 1-like [Aristolochia californica]|uniref:protein WEAK CHLOROPLAST MOVEMENT UNDER BLUE LIGHT 1-like n=1 Tax=Aristolochia californica TaxID=171875 RepID=UPI0035D5A530
MENQNQSFDGAEDDSKSESINKKAELKAALFELAQTKKAVEQAREAAVRSWLDSKPLFDELDKIQSDLSKAKSRVSMATITISTIESQLEATKTSLDTKQEEERDERRRIEEIRRSLDQTRGDMAKLKVEVTDERLARTKLKQEYRFKRQSLKALQLMHRAARMESDAYRASVGAALSYIKHSKMENPTVELSSEEYYELIRKANEETTLADWRVSVSMEQRQTAEKQQQEALRRLNEVQAPNKRQKKSSEIVEEQDYIRNQQQLRPSTSQQNHPPQAKDTEKFISGHEVPQRMRVSKSSSRNKKVTKKKPSVLHHIRSFLLRHIRNFFG